jgi:PTS system nitrogen regulatory IIA component
VPRSILSVKEVAASLHVSEREVMRMADQGILPGTRVRGKWQFRAGEIWNWIEKNADSLSRRRTKDPNPAAAGPFLISQALHPAGIALDAPSKTGASVLRTLAGLAEAADEGIDGRTLLSALQTRERQGSTALERGVAVPHPARPVFSNGPLVVAVRTAQGLHFGQRDGGTTNLYFLVSCPEQADHLFYFGRLCRLLIEPDLLDRLRRVDSPGSFRDTIEGAERALCSE